MKDSEIKNFSLLPVTILSSFGHNGLDWIHSLLDGHDEIVLMPAYSFFRTLDFYEKEKGKNLIENQKRQSISKEFTEYVFNNPSYQVVRRKFLFSENDAKIFEFYLNEYLQRTEEKSNLKALFFGINFSYCKVFNINISNIKIIISQEHVSWHTEKYKNLFDANFIFMMRDPRAGLAGGWKRQVENAGYPSINPYDFDKGILAGTYLEHFCKKHKKYMDEKARIMVNEKMHQNLKKEMQDLCYWLKLDFLDSCLEETFLGKEWLGESSYLGIDELTERPPKDFYAEENVEKRWRKRLNENEIIMIEYLFKYSFHVFGYSRDTLNNFKNTYTALYKYLFTMLINPLEKEKYLLPIKVTRNFIRRIIILYFPLQASKIFKIL